MNALNKNQSESSLLSLDSSNEILSDLDNTLSVNSGYSSTSSSCGNASTQSILQPIHVRDARTRSYLVGSVGFHVCSRIYLFKSLIKLFDSILLLTFMIKFWSNWL
jgi:hypothetical protein